MDANLRAAGFDAKKDFDAIVSADAFEQLKPAPDVFLAAAQALGTHPDNCVVLEDAPAGIQAARAAGEFTYFNIRRMSYCLSSGSC